jgi:hypothetical protein
MVTVNLACHEKIKMLSSHVKKQIKENHGLPLRCDRKKNTYIKPDVYVEQQLSNICLFLDVNNYSSYNASPMRKERAYAYKEIWRACAY